MMSRQEETDTRYEDEEMTIDLVVLCKDFFQNVRKYRIRILGMALLVSVLFSLLATLFYRPQYTAFATYSVTIQKEFFGTTTKEKFVGNKVAEQINTTLPYILTSDLMKRKVAGILGEEKIQGTIDAKVAENTNFLTIACTDRDPASAYRTLQAVVESYPVVSEQVIGKVFLEQMDGSGVPEEPDNANSLVRRLILGFLIGLALMLFWCLMGALLKKTVTRKEDCQEKLNTRCLGVVPEIHSKARSRKVVRSELNILDEKTDQEFVDVFAEIRNRIEFSAQKNKIKTILLTSSLGSEGKSTIAVNLALSLASEGKKVALVDCDLRHPSDGMVVNYKGKAGLIDYLKGKVTLEKCLVYGKNVLNTSLPVVFVFGGEAVPDGARYLTLDKMEQMIHLLESQVDFVILDTAPVGLMTDATILAQYADGAVFVVKSDYARTDHILDSMNQILECNVHMIGCILNKGQ